MPINQCTIGFQFSFEGCQIPCLNKNICCNNPICFTEAIAKVKIRIYKPNI
jgi:hypothetical protein